MCSFVPHFRPRATRTPGRARSATGGSTSAGTRRRFRGTRRRPVTRPAPQRSGVLLARLVLGELGADIGHVERLDGSQDLLERRRGQRARLGEDEDAPVSYTHLTLPTILRV